MSKWQRRLYARTLPPGFVSGTDGVFELDDGSHWNDSPWRNWMAVWKYYGLHKLWQKGV